MSELDKILKEQLSHSNNVFDEIQKKVEKSLTGLYDVFKRPGSRFADIPFSAKFKVPYSGKSEVGVSLEVNYHLLRFTADFGGKGKNLTFYMQPETAANQTWMGRILGLDTNYRTKEDAQKTEIIFVKPGFYFYSIPDQIEQLNSGRERFFAYGQFFKYLKRTYAEQPELIESWVGCLNNLPKSFAKYLQNLKLNADEFKKLEFKSDIAKILEETGPEEETEEVEYEEESEIEDDYKEKPQELKGDLTGSEIDGYTLKKVLGTGGFSTVYLAESMTGKKKAMKILNEGTDLNSLLQEVQANKVLNHDNIIDIEHIKTNGFAYILMEYFNAKSLRKYNIKSDDDRQKLISQILKGLSHAHKQGVVHGDIKPENILVNRTKKVKITDFGLSRNTRDIPQEVTTICSLIQSQEDLDKVLMGTIQYMAPEQLNGEKATKKSDVYSLGLVLFELYAGRLPERAEKISKTLKSLKIPNKIISIIDKCLERSPEDRYKDIASVDRLFPRQPVKHKTTKKAKEAVARPIETEESDDREAMLEA